MSAAAPGPAAGKSTASTAATAATGAKATPATAATATAAPIKKRPPPPDAKIAAPFALVERQFRRVLGADSVDTLYARVTPNPVVTVGGDQLTGKSTLAASLKQWLGAEAHSAGSIFRAEAVRRGVSLPELSRRAKADPAIDVCIEYRVCELIARGLDDGSGRPLIIEGRQPAVMAQYMQHCHGKRHTVRVYLACDVREQALRFIQREGGVHGPELAQKVDASLPKTKVYRTLNAVAQDILALGLPELTACMERFVDNANRDDDDRTRYAALYGLGAGLDYRDRALYDIVVDTTLNQPADTFAAVKAAYTAFVAKQQQQEQEQAAGAAAAAGGAAAAAKRSKL